MIGKDGRKKVRVSCPDAPSEDGLQCLVDHYGYADEIVLVETDAEKIEKLEDHIALLEKAITDEMARVDTLRDMLIKVTKLGREANRRIEELERNAFRPTIGPVPL